MRTNTMSYAMALAAGALGVAGAVAIATASPSWAAPVAPDTTAVRTAASNQLIDVQYHRRGYYGRGYGRGYYGHGYGRRYYGQGYYRRGYGYIPTQAMPILIIILMPILPLTSASVSVGAVGNFAASSCSGGSWRNWIEAGDASGRKPPRMPWP